MNLKKGIILAILFLFIKNSALAQKMLISGLPPRKYLIQT